MLAFAGLLLSAAFFASPGDAVVISRSIDVDCTEPYALRRALRRSRKLGGLDIRLHGMCEGSFRIAHDGVTLRAGSPGAGIRERGENPEFLPVIEVDDAQVSLRGLIISGILGVRVHGANAELFVYDTKIEGAAGLGIWADQSATVRLLESEVSGHAGGIFTDDGVTLNLQQSTVSGNDVGIQIHDSRFAMSDSTIEDNVVAGLGVSNRSDGSVFDTAFRNNGQVHVSVVDRSSVSLVGGVTLGSDTDTTQYALTSARDSRASAALTPDVFGDVSALDGGTLRLRSGVLHGNLLVQLFSDAHVRAAEITGLVFCDDGSESICSQTTSAGVIGCPTTTCGDPLAPNAAVERPAAPPTLKRPRLVKGDR
ncbi:MAG: right-handed parallel beta-helix repeat-containing protein [Acidobacteriota bacterium]|nr:right-handed parallel beta-helix repeat-containing protein [Acidobacteriota bacterium]MDH3783844.1 right-handed parallel beta-helix repeat-containing protein [Acidobacteriota bacterium]